VLLAGAYAEFDWDSQTGQPNEGAIRELGL